MNLMMLALTHCIGGAVLAVIVIWLFLGNWRAAVISALAMPLSLIPSFRDHESMQFHFE